MPILYIIAGSNGAGKTTFAETFLPHYAGCVEFVNADMIAKGLSPFASEKAAMQAGRLMLERIRSLMGRGADFALETTLAGRTYASILRYAREEGYTTRLAYVWVPSAEMSVQRVADRVRRGGHNIPADVIRHRFSRSLANLFHLYMPLLDTWGIYDNSRESPRLVARSRAGAVEVFDTELYATIEAQANRP